ncbi:GNAT family N-acetyltransferase [Phenylobacterium sp. J367]|uniref:GNAT family N-acetyltransferase n=1 Tax=Phenylobacterium sp. J367 TaxID=2898435 RepID=UPI002150853A|nr:GNAT family N-acetyltransferase [Phenylobacterium sp. J367]MCR5877099.1 GNAT family N-acetyltransferase [Phenylobacterium sp. J367]
MTDPPAKPPPDIVVRAAEPADIPAMTEVLNQPRAVWGTLQTPLMSAAMREDKASFTDLNRRQLVAEADGRVVGTIGLSREPYHRRSHTASIGMAVHDAFAGRGIGTALMAAVVDLAERWWNIRRLELNVYADNAPAIALYERFGFEREGLLRAYAWRDGAYVDSWRWRGCGYDASQTLALGTAFP